MAAIAIDTHTGTASTANAEEAGAPVRGIEITPEMIEAGVEVVSAFFGEAVAFGSETANAAGN